MLQCYNVIHQEVPRHNIQTWQGIINYKNISQCMHDLATVFNEQLMLEMSRFPKTAITNQTPLCHNKPPKSINSLLPSGLATCHDKSSISCFLAKRQHTPWLASAPGMGATNRNHLPVHQYKKLWPCHGRTGQASQAAGRVHICSSTLLPWHWTNFLSIQEFPGQP